MHTTTRSPTADRSRAGRKITRPIYDDRSIVDDLGTADRVHNRPHEERYRLGGRCVAPQRAGRGRGAERSGLGGRGACGAFPPGSRPRPALHSTLNTCPQVNIVFRYIVLRHRVYAGRLTEKFLGRVPSTSQPAARGGARTAAPLTLWRR
ncbi:hypothetical protein EVAR_95405_1 [Eumeta japonica]|uniref:Uncharacterized protein n=1 Tax=Eumeta variegata TaxID=151549 RepID=A0A4C1VL83_EUMVA|nr:hypothetical protein EVAR_95405_1 [Eumeta japonica]